MWLHRECSKICTQILEVLMFSKTIDILLKCINLNIAEQ